jgi:hypothetical protein
MFINENYLYLHSNKYEINNEYSFVFARYDLLDIHTSTNLQGVGIYHHVNSIWPKTTSYYKDEFYIMGHMMKQT